MGPRDETGEALRAILRVRAFAAPGVFALASREIRMGYS